MMKRKQTSGKDSRLRQDSEDKQVEGKEEGFHVVVGQEIADDPKIKEMIDEWRILGHQTAGRRATGEQVQELREHGIRVPRNLRESVARQILERAEQKEMENAIGVGIGTVIGRELSRLDKEQSERRSRSDQ